MEEQNGVGERSARPTNFQQAEGLHTSNCTASGADDCSEGAVCLPVFLIELLPAERRGRAAKRSKRSFRSPFADTMGIHRYDRQGNAP
jgi:hypothetical protein